MIKLKEKVRKVFFLLLFGAFYLAFCWAMPLENVPENWTPLGAVFLAHSVIIAGVFGFWLIVIFSRKY
jgi:hypothetical protein